MAKVSTIDAEKLLNELPNGYRFDRIRLVSAQWNPETDGWNISDKDGTVVHTLKLGETNLGIYEKPINPALREWFNRYSQLIGAEVQLTSYVAAKKTGLSVR